jgi:cyanate lyase
MQETEFWAISLPVLVALVGLVLGLIKLGKVWVDSKAAEIQAGIKSEEVGNAFYRAEQLVTTAVLQTAQVEADAFKSAAADGKLTEEEMKELRDLAISRAKSFITDDLMDLLMENIKDVDAWLEAQVEATVRRN